MNVFKVNIGNRTTRGKYQILKELIVKTESNESDLSRFMENKYSAFEVYVSSVESVTIDDIPSKQTGNLKSTELEDAKHKIRELEDELGKANSTKYIRESYHTIHISKFSKETLDSAKNSCDLLEEYNKEKNKLNTLLCNDIMQDKPYISSVSFKSFNHRVDHNEFKIRYKDSIEYIPDTAE